VQPADDLDRLLAATEEVRARALYTLPVPKL
jgi:hypothetical protein